VEKILDAEELRRVRRAGMRVLVSAFTVAAMCTGIFVAFP
jgi:hypothetical protein